MGLRLEIISQHRQGLGEIGIKEFGQDGGTIGRSLSNDWALPDRNRFLSARHAAIDYRSGSYYIVDTSTNGVFVNESDVPVGRGNPQRLFDGDRIRIGEYIIVAKIDQDETMDALADGHVDPVELAQRVDRPEATGHDLLDAHIMTGVGIEMMIEDSGKRSGRPATGATRVQPSAAATGRTRSLLMGQPAAPGPKPAPTQHTVPQPPRRSAAARPAAPARAPTPPSRTATPAPASQPATRQAAPRPRPAPAGPSAPPPAVGAAKPDTDAPLSAFFRGAGLTQKQLTEQECNAMLFLLGQLTRELLTGVAESLHLRAQQKTQLKLANTTIQKKDNNPLKFSAGTTEALQNLLFKTSREYMGPVEAVRDAFADLCGHQQALLKALGVAVPEYVNRLDPIVLEDKFARAGRGNLMAAATRIKHWELYKDLFQVVAHHNPGQLPTQFLEELARAYEEENLREMAVRKRGKTASGSE
jgi:type VI secretion system protein